jgi:hypothetical protein
VEPIDERVATFQSPFAAIKALPSALKTCITVLPRSAHTADTGNDFARY